MAEAWSVSVLVLTAQLFEFRGVAGARAWAGSYFFISKPIGGRVPPR
jgi:hypothetical protein